MKREVLWRQSGVDDLLLLAARNQRQATRVAITVRAFAAGERTDLKKLEGQDHWRIRVGDWRVILDLVGGLAYITAVSDRQDAY